MNPSKSVVIAIDGPSGAGKSTVARLVARRLDYLFLDTGAMYRAVTFALIRHGISSEDAGVARFLQRLRLHFSPDGERIFLQIDNDPEEDVSAEIRTKNVTDRVSEVAALASVRAKLTTEQRAIAEGRPVVAEGRDTATVVFPDASRKFFLTASLEARVKRRQAERPELANRPVAEVAADIQRRDEKDSRRALAPLRPAESSIQIDTTELQTAQVVERILSYL
ncbi:MAG: (d)CMP kinase [Planctomycetes bacterium]|nr:(d)CMP kinase [Planctomycetota bacterium]